MFTPCQACIHAFQVPNTEFYDGAQDLTHHPGHLPFISHVTFRNLCNHVIDETTQWFNPKSVQTGDLVYLNVWYLNWFAKYVHDQIEYPYILVTGDVGNWLPDITLQKLLYDPKLAAWFGRNMIFSFHPKLFQIPMGQDLSLFGFGSQTTEYLIKTGENPPPKKHLLYMNHYPRVHGDRHQLVTLFENEPYCLSKNHSDQPFTGTPYPQYCEELASCYFTLSPLGLETDCVRTWEAIVLDTIPIVEHTFLDPSYEDLPVLIIDDWEDITPSFLEQKYSELKNKSKTQAYFEYWENLIQKTQKKIEADDTAFSELEMTAFPEEDLKDLENLLSDFPYLIYKGFLSSIRPLQLAKAIPSLEAIFLYDPWVSGETYSHFHEYLDDSSWLLYQYKIHIINHENQIFDPSDKEFSPLHYQSTNPYAVFLDLTYYRHSLATDFSNDFMNRPRGVHLLTRDLVNLYNELPIFTFLCGNMHKDPYVKKSLIRLAEETGVEIGYKGSFWYLSK